MSEMCDELRAILAPLLDAPRCTEVTDPYGPCGACKFCASLGDHAPDCPVLRRGTLLGREATT